MQINRDLLNSAVYGIAFYPQSVGAIKLKYDRGRSDGRDKTCWTKARSRTEVAAMRIVKWHSGAEGGAVSAIDREAGEG